MKKRAFGKLYKELFYIPKHEKLTEKVFRCRMITSMLTMLACIAVLITSTLAWFNMSITTQVPAITSAYYSVLVGNARNGTYNGTYICPLTYEDKHEFVITANGTATTGYCKIQVDESTYYTEQISQGTSLNLTIQAAQGTEITFTPQWGLSSSYTNENTRGDVINHSETLYTTYKVEPTATLEGISQYYNVSVPDILTYNGITELTVGAFIKIPGVSRDTTSYVAPVTETPANTDENAGDNTQGENNVPPVVDDTVSNGNVGTEEQPTEETTTPVEGGTPTDTPPSEDQPTSSDAQPSEAPTVDTPAEDTTPTEETSTTEQSTPAPEETHSVSEQPAMEEPATETPTEEPAPAGDEPTDTGETE